MFTFSDNLLLQAGAGTGKTHGLVTQALHLLAGATARRAPVAPGRLAAITFTEKAAAEMKERLRARVLRLAERPAELSRAEPELRASLDGLGLKAPPAALWQRARRDLGLFFVGTFHSFAGQLLRRHPAEAGVDPRFAVLEEAEARALAREAAEEVVLEELLDAASDARRLAAVMGYEKLVAALLEVRARAVEDGADLGALEPAAPGAEADAQVAALAAKWRGTERTGKNASELKAIAEQVAAHDAVALQAGFARVLLRAEAAYRSRKRARAALDFSDLLLSARRLLAGHEEVRAELQGRLDALLVDELQDTNRVQLEIVRAAAGARPAALFAVGDRKQSIYDFRGADLAVFEELLGAMPVRYLTSSRRARPQLLRFANRLFARALAGFDPEKDGLQPERPEGPPGPCAELLAVSPDGNAEARRAREAAAVARRIAALLQPDAPPIVEDRERRGRFRKPRGGDIAIVLRRFTFLDVFLRELAARRVPHAVVRGRGFYGAQEVRDLAALVALIADPQDDIALASVLRGPLCAASDEALFSLALAGAHDDNAAPRLRLSRFLSEPAPAGTPPDESARLTEFARLFRRLRAEADRLGAPGILRAAVAETGLKAALAATYGGEQACANLDKLLAEADAWERRGGDLRSFARLLRELTDEEPPGSDAAQADVVEEKDPRAVRVLTIHQAKGLEFPIVFVPECGATVRNEGAAALYDRSGGLALRGRGPDGTPQSHARYVTVRDARTRRAEAESWRLFYVAATRARDYLVFSGEASPNRNAATWRSQLDALTADDGAGELLRRVDGDHFPEPPRPAPRPVQAEFPDRSRAEAAARAVLAPAPVPSPVTAPVTQLQDFGLCARRYFYRHVVGIEEHPPVPLAPGDADGGGTPGDGDPWDDPLRRGTLAHRLLERAELARGGADLDALLADEGLDPRDPALASIRDDAAAFLRTPFAREIARLPAGQVRRELSFMLALPGLYLKGQIDLLVIGREGRATVVDYKHTHREGHPLASYRFQLRAYALAVQTLFAAEGTPALPIRAGIVFLRDRGEAPLVEDVSPEELAAFERELSGLASGLARERATDTWPLSPVAHCRAIRCGYVGRCHPGE